MKNEKARHHMPEYKLGQLACLSGVDLAALILLGRVTVSGLYAWMDRHGGTAACHDRYPQIRQALALVRQERKRDRQHRKVCQQLAALNAAVGGSSAASALMQGGQQV